MTLAQWNPFAAELADTSRSMPQRRPCLICGTPTVSLYGVCFRHDLSVLEEPPTCAGLQSSPDRALPSPTGGSSSADSSSPVDTERVSDGSALT